MSTEHQKYSTQNQSHVIAEYARERGLTIVRRYADEGKSGLSFEGRPALQRLIADVQSGTADFKTVLVYDVSRWGRFQNSDESAYYEFICKLAGIQVRYCAEPFENDGSMFAALVKSIKRLMAGEYSRELSAKVFAAKSALIRLGFRQGGQAGYGLRRLVIDEHRNPKFLLAAGEGKAIHTDRIVLVPGSSREVKVVRDIFELFVSKRKSQSEIVRILNRKAIANHLGRPWHRRHVHDILTNEKYIGNNVWNRASFKLQKKLVRNPREEWVRADRVFQPIVDESVFDAARQKLQAKTKRFSNDEALLLLRSCLRRHRRLTSTIIDADKGTPCAVTYQHKFGSLQRAYKLVGYQIDERARSSYELTRQRLSRRKALLDAAIQVVIKAGGEVRRSSGVGAFVVDGCISIMTKVVTNRDISKSPLGWDLRVGTSSPDITVAATMDRESGAILDYYLLPRSAVEKNTYVHLASTKENRWKPYRSSSLKPLPELITRIKDASRRRSARRTQRN